MWQFTAKSHWRPYLEVSCSGKYSAGPVLPLWNDLRRLMLSWKFTMTMMIGIGTSIIIIIITFSLAVNNEATMLLHNIKYQCWDLRNVDLYRCMILGRDDTVTCRTAHTIQSFVPSWIRKENQIIAWEEVTIIGRETDRTTRRSADQGGHQNPTGRPRRCEQRRRGLHAVPLLRRRLTTLRG